MLELLIRASCWTRIAQIDITGGSRFGPQAGHMLITPTFLLTHKWSVRSCFTFTMWKPRYSSRVISAVMLRSHCSLAMLNCAWMAQPHAVFQLAHSDIAPRGAMAGKKKKKKNPSRDKVEESGHSGDGAWVETGSEAGTQRSLKLTFIRSGKTDLIFQVHTLLFYFSFFLRKLIRTN